VLARSAVLIDFKSGKILFEKNADEAIPPASLTKLVTIHVAYDAMAKGQIACDDMVFPGPNSWFQNIPAGSSLMFLEKGQRVSVMDLLRGLAVSSGNDAAIALAEYISGGIDQFADLMNSEMERMGLQSCFFVEPSGLSAENRITARQFALFMRLYLLEYPGTLEELHSVPHFTYPLEKHLLPGTQSTYGPITQENRNLLITRFDGVDGLKTGYIEESGFNIAVTGTHDGRRVIAVLLGVDGATIPEGVINRAIDAAHLLAYGYYSFSFMTPQLDQERALRVYGGEARSVSIRIKDPEDFVIPLHMKEQVEKEIFLEKFLRAPVRAGQPVGKVTFRLEDEVLFTGDIVAGDFVAEKGPLSSFFDEVRILFRPLIPLSQ
jgi:D-alanyl-D-alanine carboxypeptidase (penicillin-binding protein 5/6)